MTVDEYNRCVDLWSDKVYRIILKNLGQSADAKDVIQTAFEKLWENHSNISFEKGKSWLFTVAYRIMIDLIRKRKRIEIRESIPEREQWEYLQTTGLKEVLDQALARLPEVQRSVVLLRDYEGYSYKEIGSILSLKESQVKVYIFRARAALRKYLVSIEHVL